MRSGQAVAIMCCPDSSHSTADHIRSSILNSLADAGTYSSGVLTLNTRLRFMQAGRRREWTRLVLPPPLPAPLPAPLPVPQLLLLLLLSSGDADGVGLVEDPNTERIDCIGDDVRLTAEKTVLIAFMGDSGELERRSPASGKLLVTATTNGLRGT